VSGLEPGVNLGEALEIATCTDPGIVRSHNEDSIAADASIGLAVLADGMGGYNAGEVASGMATTVITSELQGLIKRVVALGGDRISIRDGHVVRNGVREKDPYIVQCAGDSACNFPRTITIPRGDYYMMGDNRPDSEDSRFWGPVPKSWIIGKAFFTYWPPDRIGTL